MIWSSWNQGLCLSYFSAALVKHYSQGNLEKEGGMSEGEREKKKKKLKYKSKFNLFKNKNYPGPR